jgi:1-acyl-sn-glycerol-3-phosphate acyltransferase
VEGLPELERRGWYLVLANHQSWVDILVLQRIFNRRIPLLTFFLKRERIWVPILGLAWWALDFPFMKRYSKDLPARKPHLAGKDLEITRRACEKFRHHDPEFRDRFQGWINELWAEKDHLIDRLKPTLPAPGSRAA